MENIQQLPETETQSAPANRSHLLFSLARYLRWLKNVFDYIGGSREKPPAGIQFLGSPWWLGLWWGLLVGLILLFCGQTSKFIYIDF